MNVLLAWRECYESMLRAGWRKVEAGNLIKPLPEILSKGLPKAKA